MSHRSIMTDGKCSTLGRPPSLPVEMRVRLPRSRSHAAAMPSKAATHSASSTALDRRPRGSANRARFGADGPRLRRSGGTRDRLVRLFGMVSKYQNSALGAAIAAVIFDKVRRRLRARHAAECVLRRKQLYPAQGCEKLGISVRAKISVYEQSLMG